MQKADITDLLIRSGWQKGRKVNVDNIILDLVKEGYNVNEAQTQFLTEFNGISVSFINPRLNSSTEILTLDALKASSTTMRSLVSEYEEYFNSTFVIIGEIEQENMTLYIDNKGEFYGGFDDCVIKLGIEFDECLFNIVSGVKLDIIYI